jgi:hypothetical protein
MLLKYEMPSIKQEKKMQEMPFCICANTTQIPRVPLRMQTNKKNHLPDKDMEVKNAS